MVGRDDRFHALASANPDDPRPPARRDRDRILYSSAFRRLGGITQVVSATDRHPIHTRLTHTLEVAQIGRSLAEKLLATTGVAERAAALGGLDPDVVEAACLAHDLGHPPFGHVAEAELDRRVRLVADGVDGFEGNAQTFRIVTRLGVRYPTVPGFNLTRATLCAVLKYPWLRGTGGERARKWGAYASEADEFVWSRRLLPGPGMDGRRSLEAELMDWADDVAYAVHDVEDFYRAGLIPLGTLATSPTDRGAFVEAELSRNARLQGDDPDDLARAFDELMSFLPVFEPYRGDRESRARLRSLTSSLVDRYVRAVSLDAAGAVAIAPEARLEVAMLKGLTDQYVIESRALLTQRYGQKRVIAALFATLGEIGASPRDRRVFPEFHRELLGVDPSDAHVARTVADLIASMTEAQVVEMHHRLTGVALGGALDPIVP